MQVVLKLAVDVHYFAPWLLILWLTRLESESGSAGSINGNYIHELLIQLLNIFQVINHVKANHEKKNVELIREPFSWEGGGCSNRNVSRGKKRSRVVHNKIIGL